MTDKHFHKPKRGGKGRITARNQSALSVQESEARFRAFMTYSPALAFLKDADGRYVWVSPPCAESFQISANEWIGRTDAEIFPGRVGAMLREHDMAVLTREQSMEFEESVPLPDGLLHHWLVMKFPFRTSQGQCLLGGMAVDISQRLEAERALRESEERVRAIVNTAVDAIITIDGLGKIQEINGGAEQMFGYAAAEVVGKNVNILMPSPYHEQHDGYLARYRETGERRMICIGRELLGRRKDGSIFPVELAVSEIDHLGLFTGILRDVSERKELQRQVLMIAEQEQRRIGQELHDDIQQQLAGLGLLAQNMADHIRRLSGKDSAEIGAAQYEEASRLADRVARGIAETGRRVRLIGRGLVPVEVDAEGLRSALEELAAHTSELHGVACEFQCPTPVEMCDNFVATHLYRIAQEAVTNALKHARPSRILVRLYRAEQSLVLTVLDDGIGIGEKNDSDGIGLRIMEYRAGLIGGNLSVIPGQECGTEVNCTLFPALETPCER
jgi:PAS domain S-box-containing protein